MENNILFWIWIALLAAGMILIVVRMLVGPGKANRTMALDTLSTTTTSLMMILAIKLENPFFLDIAIVYAILAFSAVLVIARYIEKGV